MLQSIPICLKIANWTVTIKSIEADIIVLKGFPVSLIEEIGKDYALLDADVYDGGKIALENINAQKLLPGIIMESGKLVCSCESFISLCNNFAKLAVLGKKIVVLENNLLTLYPNPSNHEIPDFDCDEGEDSSTALYTAYYSYAERFEGGIRVQYIGNYSEENPEVKTVPLIEPKSIVSLTNAPVRYSVALSNLEIELMLIDFYKKGSLNLSPSYVINPRQIDYARLEVLLGVAEYLNKEIILYKQSSTQSVEPRPELTQILKEIWGYDSFRSLQIYEDLTENRDIRNVSQNEIIETVIRECEKGLTNDSVQQINNILLTAPTGAGKSILFQLSAIYLAKKYHAMTIVVSPLVALMDDQVEGLTKYDRVATLNSNRTGTEKAAIVERINKGEIDILYLSPEMLLAYSINSFIGTRRLGLIVIDEAHTVTTWGRDFRVDYLFLGDYIRKARKILEYNFPIFALTATAVWDITGQRCSSVAEG